MVSPSTMTDEELARVSVLDTSLFGELIDRYHKPLSLYVMRRSHATKEDIEDILQNSFIKMYRNLNEFDHTLKFSSWAYRITHNELIDWYRKQKAKLHFASVDGDIDIVALIASDITTEKIVLQRELAEEIKKILATLDEKYQEIILLRFFEEKSYEEIADILQIPEGTVAVRLSRAKKILQEKLHSYV